MKWVVVFVYLTAILTVHLRGRVRFSLSRQLLDHSSIVAPMNLFMYLLSGVPHTPYLPIKNFPELDVLEKNWEMIREEALNLVHLEKVTAAQKNDDAGFNSFFKNGWKRFYLKWYDAPHRPSSTAQKRLRCYGPSRASRPLCLPNWVPPESSTSIATPSLDRYATIWAW